MSHNHDFTAVQMHWQPSLIKLTQIPNPDLDHGNPPPCFVAPQQIVAIHRGLTSFSKTTNGVVPPEGNREFHLAVPVTSVVLGYSLAYMVLESPETVAMLRDKALGHEPPKLGVTVNVDNILDNKPK